MRRQLLKAYIVLLLVPYSGAIHYLVQYYLLFKDLSNIVPLREKNSGYLSNITKGE